MIRLAFPLAPRAAAAVAGRGRWVASGRRWGAAALAPSPPRLQARGDPAPRPPEGETPGALPPPRRSWVWHRVPPWVQRTIVLAASYVLTHAVLSGVAAIGAVLALYWVFQARVLSHAAATSRDVLFDTLGKKEVKLQAETLSKEVVERILNDTGTLDLVVQLVAQVLQRPEVYAAVRELVVALLNDPAVRQVTAAFFVDVLRRPEIQGRVNAMGTEATSHVLHSPATQRRLEALFRDVFARRDLQVELGRALWNATWYSVTPGRLAGTPKGDARPSVVSVAVGTSDP